MPSPNPQPQLSQPPQDGVMESHTLTYTVRGARIQPWPAALGWVHPFSALGPSSSTCQWGFSAQSQDQGHLPLPSSTSATPSPVPASSHQRPQGRASWTPWPTPPHPPTPREQPEMQKQNSLSAQFYELQIHTGCATAASLAGPGPPRAIEGGSSPHGPPEVTPGSSPPPPPGVGALRGEAPFLKSLPPGATQTQESSPDSVFTSGCEGPVPGLGTSTAWRPPGSSVPAGGRSESTS